MKLAEKVALVTGAGSGIGRAIAILFAKEGAKVVVDDIVDDRGKDTVKQIKESGGEAVYAFGDVSKADDVIKLVDTTVGKFGKLDILVNNAANDYTGLLAEMPE